jgi:hypothetical protein
VPKGTLVHHSIRSLSPGTGPCSTAKLVFVKPIQTAQAVLSRLGDNMLFFLLIYYLMLSFAAEATTTALVQDITSEKILTAPLFLLCTSDGCLKATNIRYSSNGTPVAFLAIQENLDRKWLDSGL